MATKPLPLLVDCRGLQEELGVTQAVALRIMRKLPTVEPEGIRKVYVKREDVMRYLAESTRAA